jgi:hypothetical protein
MSDVAVLRVGPARQACVALKSALTRIPHFRKYREMGQAMNQDVIAPRGRMQETINSMQSKQQQPLPPQSPSEEEEMGLIMIALLMADHTPVENQKKIESYHLEERSKQRRK